MTEPERRANPEGKQDCTLPSDKSAKRISLKQPLAFFIGVGLLIVFVSITWPKWYSAQVSLQRYCDDPEKALSHLERILKENRPAGEGQRTPYIIAAKLLYLEPQKVDENQQDYLLRLGLLLAKKCND